MQDINKKIISDKARLKWACRRGMLELDILLNQFLDNKYESLSEPDKILFVELLRESDPVLFAWLLAAEVADSRFVELVEMIRTHAQSPL